MRLNRQDGGRRQTILVTNNEVAAQEADDLAKRGHRPGDPEWERLGICEHITKPRIEAAITGRAPEGKEIADDYRFVDEFPMADGFRENAEFFTLTYESPVSVRHNLAFRRIAALLWMRAGSRGRRIEDIPANGWKLADSYGLLADLDRSADFCDAVAERNDNRTNAGLDLALRQMPLAYDPTAAGRVRQMRIRLDKTGNFRRHRLPK